MRHRQNLRVIEVNRKGSSRSTIPTESQEEAYFASSRGLGCGYVNSMSVWLMKNRILEKFSRWCYEDSKLTRVGIRVHIVRVRPLMWRQSAKVPVFCLDTAYCSCWLFECWSWSRNYLMPSAPSEKHNILYFSSSELRSDFILPITLMNRKGKLWSWKSLATWHNHFFAAPSIPSRS